MGQHVCYSGDMSCSGCKPCMACLQAVRSRVLPRAMFLAGPPFNTDRVIAERFIRAFDQALHETLMAIAEEAASMAPPATHAPPAPAAIRPSVPPIAAGLSPAEELVAYRLHVEQGKGHLSQEQIEQVGFGVKSGQLPGWSELSAEQREIMREVFIPGYTSQILGDVKRAEEALLVQAAMAQKQAEAAQKAQAPEAAPPAAVNGHVDVPLVDEIPSEESAMAVATAIKNGTLGDMQKGIIAEIQGSPATPVAVTNGEGGSQPAPGNEAAASKPQAASAQVAAATQE